MFLIQKYRSALAVLICVTAVAINVVRGVVSAAVVPGSVFTVTNTNDSGPGSLRQAILDANSSPGSDTIAFNLLGPSRTIRPVLALPGITEAVVIDGSTQPGFVGTPIVELNGANSPSLGLFIAAHNTIVRSLVINSFHLSGVVLGDGSGDDRVEGCYIGTDVAGEIAAGNGASGISIFSSNNVIGGTASNTRNVISGNSEAGIQVELFCCGNTPTISGNVIQGNFIGLNKEGNRAIPNRRQGVWVTTAAGDASVTGTVIGGTAPGAGNVISGNLFEGVLLGSFTTTGNIVKGNFIGTDATGSKAVPNASNGLTIDLSRNNLIGGSEPGARNVISGNGINGSGSGAGAGVAIGSTGNIVRGNFIGTNAVGDRPLKNLLDGVFVSGSNNTIGGTSAGEGNVIAYNGFNGISAPNSASVSNSLRGNSIFSNGSSNSPNGNLGIDLGPAGPTLNDTGDADTGSNNLQNFPVISLVTAGNNSVNIKGALNSASSTTFDLDFYANSTCNPSGYGEGKRFLGSATITTDAGGNIAFDLPFANSVLPTEVITATATDPAGNTSEFSQCSTMPQPAPIQIALDLSGPDSAQAAALDSVLLLRDPFPVINGANLLNQGGDRNTRLIIFAANLQLLAGESASAVVVNLIDAGNTSYDVPAEDVRAVPDVGLTQITSRLPNGLSPGVCAIRVKAHNQVSNTATIRIR
jgi:hypothetical protein